MTIDTPETAPLPSHDVLWVFDPDGKNGPFAYTVGLAVRPELGWELAATGLPARLACAVLNNAVAQLVTEDLEPADGLALDNVLEGYEVRLRPVDDPSELNGTRAAVDGQPPVWQVLWPDADGRFPGEPGYRDVPEQRLL